MNRYLETGRAHAGVRPWAWVLLLFLGPTAGTLCEEWYQWTMVSRRRGTRPSAGGVADARDRTG